MAKLLNNIITKKEEKEKQLAVLLDPDELNAPDAILDIINISEKNEVDYFLVGGSLIMNNDFTKNIELLKQSSNIPVILFPGNPLQIHKGVDGVLFLSLISGRNPEMLIGHHVNAAPALKKMDTEILPTGYILIGSGEETSVSYISNTKPIPRNKDDIATATAIAGEMLGLKLIYMDGGSGSNKSIKNSMILNVKENINVPLIIGGGITTPTQAENAFNSGADMIVIGNAIERSPELIDKVGKCLV